MSKRKTMILVLPFKVKLHGFAFLQVFKWTTRIVAFQESAAQVEALNLEAVVLKVENDPLFESPVHVILSSGSIEM